MLLTDKIPPLARSDRPVAVAPESPTPLTPAAPGTASLARQIDISEAGWQDWAAISHLVAQNFPLVTEASLSYWLCHQRPYFRVARLHGRTIGFLHAQPRPDSKTLWVNLLAVDAQHRQQGVAHRLVEHADSVCRDWSCDRIGLQCLVHNEAALALYASHGYAAREEMTVEQGQRVVPHLRMLPVHHAPRSAPRPVHALDPRPLRLAYRLLYLAWFRHRSPMPR